MIEWHDDGLDGTLRRLKVKQARLWRRKQHLLRKFSECRAPWLRLEIAWMVGGIDGKLWMKPCCPFEEGSLAAMWTAAYEASNDDAQPET